MKKILFFALCMLFALMPLAAQDDRPSADDLPTLDELEPGWNILEGSEETVCSRGDDYQFFVRPGESPESRLVVYFQGGGACWNGLLCADNGPYDATVTDSELDDYEGIFRFVEANPLVDDHFVFVPYCTADVFTGSNTHEYSPAVSIEHQGFTNASYVMDWVYDNFEAPEQILVTGSSAGAYGAIMFAPFLMEQYPDAQVVQFGDAGVGVTPVGWAPLGTWGIYENMPPFIDSLANTDPETFTINVLYAESAAAYPDQQFAQFTNVDDEVQINFYNFSTPTPNDWTTEMRQKLAELDALENFSYYVAPGADHTILASDQLYTLSSDGVDFIDWFSELLEGEPVEDVACAECDAE